MSLEGLSVVIPVYKEDPHTVTRLYCELAIMGAEVIVVNDGDTVSLPDEIEDVHYKPNMGYGYAIKKGVERASHDVVMTLDGDGQHTTQDAIRLYETYKAIGDCAMVVGQRWGLDEKPHRKIGRKVLNFVASVLSGHYLPDLNSGMRIVQKRLLEDYKPILCDTFSYTTSLTMSVVTDNHRFAYIPIDVQPREVGKSHVRVINDGLVTIWYILKIGFALRTRGIRAWLRKLYSRAT